MPGPVSSPYEGPSDKAPMELPAGETKSGEGKVEGMSPRDHKARHTMLHRRLDELLADWIRHNDKGPSQATVLELVQWSYKQTLNPTEPDDG